MAKQPNMSSGFQRQSTPAPLIVPAQPVTPIVGYQDISDDPPYLVDGSVHLDPAQLQRLSALLGYNIQDAETLIHRVALTTTAKVDGVEVSLSDGLRKRLQSRAGKYWSAEWVKKCLTDQLHAFVVW